MNKEEEFKERAEVLTQQLRTVIEMGGLESPALQETCLNLIMKQFLLTHHEATVKERERCAGIAEKQADFESESWKKPCLEIAAAIRKDSTQ